MSPTSLQIEATRDLGNGSAAVCDSGAPTTPTPGATPQGAGGVPGINPPNFDTTSQKIVDALNDFACRFYSTSDVTGTSACTLDRNGNLNFVCGPTSKTCSGSTIQYCTLNVLGSDLAFQSGDTVLTAQVRDTGGHVGFPRQIVVRAP